jgi:large subunit ribosomal protein L23
MDDYQIIVRPLHTEKSVRDIRENNTYHFEVHPDASKTMVREAIESLFPEVRVRDVRTINMKGKTRRRGRVIGSTSDWKKAMVRLRPGDTIEMGY